MRLRRHSSSRLSDAIKVLCRDDRARSAILARCVHRPFTGQDVVATLLGDDLWFPALRDYRVYLESIDRRPHLWEFAFEESGKWHEARWQSLTLRARIARTRIGSIVSPSVFAFAPSAVGLTHGVLRDALRELTSADLCEALADGSYYLAPIASGEAVRGDLHLAEIIAHWLVMLAHADRVAKIRGPSGYEVSGYDRACPACRAAWGVRPRAPEWIPPFHPGCRCFAQPRFARSVR